MDELDPAAFPVEHATVRDGVEVAYVRANPGGFPLLLVHGWPETMRIWWRNVDPLAEAGFEVIVPDLRGFGRSGLAPDDRYDMAASARDLHALVAGALGHERCAAVGGDYGGVVIQDLGLRFEGFVARQCLFNTVLPWLQEAYEAAGISQVPPHRARMSADYFVRQGSDADALAAELDTPARRRGYVGDMYRDRFWAAPGAFDAAAIDFMTEPFGDAEKLRASFGLYESAMGARPASEPPRFFEPSPVETLVLYGPEDHVIWSDFVERAEVAFSRCVGPFVVPGAGHFLQWERADLLNRALVAFLRDLLAA
ncbi:MAG: alpha/beta hydrolase [Actinomycetota bacterium]|nr:alpha/beta hydrolase [Actinomycetota bacterium]